MGGDSNEDHEDDDGATPIIFARVGADRWGEGFTLPCKGVGHAYCAQALSDAIRRAGHRRILARSDGEPAIQALIAKAAALLRDEGIEVIPDPARTGDSNANGLAEGAVKEGKAKTRTCKLATEQLLNIQIGPDHQCLPFLVGYACSTMTAGGAVSMVARRTSLDTGNRGKEASLSLVSALCTCRQER